MNKKVQLTYLLLSIILGASCCFALELPNNKTKQIVADKPVLEAYSLFIPANTTCKAILADSINSKNAIIGQTVTAILLEDFKYKNTTIASKESIIEGTITNKTFDSDDKSAQIQVKFTTIRTPYNNIIPISASILTENFDGKLKPSDSSKEVSIKANTPIDIVFEQPITLKAQ
ncbi:hypothetical protein IJX73_01270 [bacterium]|nr:hypothetical protein [bacterium]